MAVTPQYRVPGMCLRWCLFVLALLQVSCILVYYLDITSSESHFRQPLLKGLKSIQALMSNPHLLNINASSPVVFRLKDQDLNNFFHLVGSEHRCYIGGSHMLRSLSAGRCICHEGAYFGEDCGIPEVLQNQAARLLVKEVTRRRKPRRLIYALHTSSDVILEQDLVEILLQSLHEVADVIIFGERIVTQANASALSFLKKFQSGWLKEIQEKMVYLFLNDHEDPRRQLSKQGLRQLTDVRLDDLFIVTCINEVPRSKVLKFLKLYDGFSQPVAFGYETRVFGYFWKASEKTFNDSIPVPTAVSVKFLRDFLDYDASLLLQQDIYFKSPGKSRFREMYHSQGESIDNWDIYSAGWKCSYCYPDYEQLSKKLELEAHSIWTQSDFDLLRKEGLFFDGRSLQAHNSSLAPSFVLKHPSKFKYMLQI